MSFRFHRSARETSIILASMAAFGCSNSRQAKTHLDLGDRYVQQAKLAEAIVEYKSALQSEHENIRALSQLGYAQYELGQLSQAYNSLLAAERLKPSDARVRITLGMIDLIRSDADGARQEALTVLGLDPGNLDALNLLGASAVDPGNLDDAIRRLVAARPTWGASATPRLVLASLYARRGNSAAAAPLLHEIRSGDTSAVTAAALLNFGRAGRDSADANNGKKAARADRHLATPDLVRLAKLDLLMNQRDSAAGVLRELVKGDPSYLAAWRELSELASAGGRADEVIPDLAHVFEQDSADVDARIARAAARLSHGDAEAAANELAPIVTVESTLTPARYQLALARLSQNNLSEAAAELEEVTRQAPNYAPAALQLASLDIRRGDPGSAVTVMRNLIAVDPNSANAYTLLGWAYRANGEPSSATRTFRKIVGVSPGSPTGPYWIGVGLLAEGRKDEARNQFEAALTLSPTYAEALSQLAETYFEEGRPSEAIERIKKQVAIAPESARLRNTLGVAYEQVKQDDNAAEEYAAAFKLDPLFSDAYTHLAVLDFRLGRADQGIAVLNGLLKVDPTNLPALMLQGTELQREGRVDGAREVYERVLTINPRFADAANNLAILLSENGGDETRALKLAEVAVAAAPDNPHIADTLGWLLCKRASGNAAQDSVGYRRATRLLAFSASKIPNDPEILFHLGIAAQKTGDAGQARQALTRALASPLKFAGREDAQKALALLK